MSEYLWVEKYRPQTIDDCVLPKSVERQFKKFRGEKYVPNLLLTGTAGRGKSAVGIALLKELGYDYLFINASLQRGIDTVRNDIQQFASSVSLFSEGRKFVFLDEADNMTPDMQMGLRGCIEEFANNCGFILTCNFKNKIIAPLRDSRLVTIDFAAPPNERKEIMAKFAQRLAGILEKEGFEYEPAALLELVKKNYPDFRLTINKAHMHCLEFGKLDVGVMTSVTDSLATVIDEYIDALKKGDYPSARKWIGEHQDIDIAGLFAYLYKVADKRCKSVTDVAHLIHLMGEYQYKAAFVANPAINLAAFTAEAMGDVNWK